MGLFTFVTSAYQKLERKHPIFLGTFALQTVFWLKLLIGAIYKVKNFILESA
jgi:hypothetical protein